MDSRTPTLLDSAAPPRLIAFGTAALWHGSPGDQRPTVALSKPLALLTFLAFSPRRTATRDRLCDLLWADREIEEGRAQLRQALWLCRRKAPALTFRSEGDSVTLTSAVESDVADFVRALETNDLARAVGEYRGDFFAGYAAPGARQFEEWAELERTRYRALAVSAVESLGRRALEAGLTAESTRHAHHLRQLDPHGEAAWRLLLESAAATGDTILARATAVEFEAWLAAEERQPDASSVASLRIATRRPASPRSDEAGDLRSEMVGRETPFSALHRAWSQARGTRAAHLHVVSETGVGKTRLITEFAEHLRAHQARAAVARAHPGDRAIAFSFAARLATVLGGRAGAAGISQGSAAILLTLNPGLSAVFAGVAADGPLDPRRVGLALGDLVSAVADDAPFALLLDDMHWVDDASLAALAVLISHLELERFLLVSTSRPHYPLGDFALDAQRLLLAPLSVGEVDALISSLATVPDTDWGHCLGALVHARSGGNPMIVLDLLRLALDDGALSRRGGVWACEDAERLTRVLTRQPAMQQRLAGLPKTERTLLLALALAGVPLTAASLSKHLGVATMELEAELRALEARGFVRSTAEGWTVGHDSILEAVTAASSLEEARSTHAALGATFHDGRSDEAERRALHHFISARAWESAAAVLVPMLRRGSASQPHAETIRRHLGPDAPDEIIEQIRRSLPARPRRRLLLLAGVGILLSVPVAAFFGRQRPAPSPLGLAVAYRDAGGVWRGTELALERSDWDPATPLAIGGMRSEWSAFGDFESDAHTVRPGSEQWVVTSVSADTGDADLQLRDLSGAVERLTDAPGQDIPFGFSPDGAHLAFGTTRWSTLGHSAVAVLDLTTRRVRRLTHSTGTEDAARWSPDGSRVAFSRYTHSTDRAEICVIETDGAREQCWASAGDDTPSIMGWRDATTLLISELREGASTLLEWSVTSGQSRPLGPLVSGFSVVDPSGRWLLSRVTVPDGPPRIVVAPTDDPSLVRQLVAPSWTGRLQAMFLSRSQVNALVDSVMIVGAASAIVPGVPHKLTARGITRDGRLVELTRVRWSASGARSRIDSLGVLVADTSGDIAIAVSVGGWRHAVARARAVAPQTFAALTELWDNEPWARWRPFGDPLPRIDSSVAADRVFLNSGDGTFFSGAYLREAIPVAGGLALELEVSTPILATQWQSLGVGLISLDSATKAAWDHRSGYPPTGGVWACLQIYPQGERRRHRNQLGPIQDLVAVLGADGALLFDGHHWVLRIQAFPDGRCGVAVDGEALFISPPSGPGFNDSTRAHAMLFGSSVGTKIAVARVTIRSGVPPDVDWTRLVPDGPNWVRHSRRR